MFPDVMPTRSPNGLRSFVHGRAAFQAYWASRRSDDLESARQDFERAESADPGFSLATFYLAVTQNELRDHVNAIARLRTLESRRVSFLPEVLLQLAYAYTKQYSQATFPLAEEALNQAHKEAKTAKRQDFLPIVDAYRVFLHAVRGGYGVEQERDAHLKEAVTLGSTLLGGRAVKKTKDPQAVQHEIHNALGIAYMRQGQRASVAANKESLWQLADQQFDHALALGPNAVRVLQNRGTLRRLQGDHLAAQGKPDDARQKYEDAQRALARSVEINRLDQFPHFSLAAVSVKLGRWADAETHYTTGRQQRGAVKPEYWATLEQAIIARDPSLIPEP